MYRVKMKFLFMRKLQITDYRLHLHIENNNYTITNVDVDHDEIGVGLEMLLWIVKSVKISHSKKLTSTDFSNQKLYKGLCNT